MKRTAYCGALTEKELGTVQTVCGWVQNKRDMGGVIFIDLRDREGTLQTVFDVGAIEKECFDLAESIRLESVVSVTGFLKKRDEETYNPKLPTGTIELKASSFTVFSESDPLPFSPEDGEKVREELRLKYRVLDLRRKKLFDNLKLRHKIQKLAQDYLDDHGFLAVETPMLTKSTPEGARDYLVPSRVHKGRFYALPQSPQIFKQLLMVGGIDRYYQIARCFRDEDLRADRQPEFTQVDMEMSFVEQEDIFAHLEQLFSYIYRGVRGVDPAPFLRITWQEAMDRYGSDKPDLRFELPIVDLTEIAKKSSFSVFRKAVEQGGVVRALTVKGGASMTRSTIEDLTKKALHYGAKGMAWIAVKEDGSLYSILTKYFTEEEMKAILQTAKAENGDFILFCADKLSTVRRTLGGLRLDLAELFSLRDETKDVFLFVTDFPQFEYSEEEKRYVASHHPFTMPYPEDVPYLLTHPEKVRAQAYDVVLNGVELGSGSIRIHDKAVQSLMFEALGFSKEEIQERFGFLIDAFRYGVPPHGGFAFGLDRFVMLLAKADSLRDVIAFPKTKDASCPLTGAPDFVDKKQLEALGWTEEALFGNSASPRSKKKETIDVLAVANLAKLEFSKDALPKLEKEMAAIIDFADQLNAAPTDGVPASAYALSLKNVFRKDEVIPSFDREELLKNAAARNDQFILVPDTFE